MQIYVMWRELHQEVLNSSEIFGVASDLSVKEAQVVTVFGLMSLCALLCVVTFRQLDSCFSPSSMLQIV